MSGIADKCEVSAKEKVFVYGTLMRGYYNNVVMQKAGGDFLGNATLPVDFEMLDLGPFPGLVPSVDGGVPIAGELWEVDSLDPLDRLEGYPSFYNRAHVILGDGTVAWVYYLQSRDRHSSRKVASGSWRMRDMGQSGPTSVSR